MFSCIFCRIMIMTGMKWSYKSNSNIKAPYVMSKLISASVLHSNFNSCLSMMSWIYITQLHIQITYRSWFIYIDLCCTEPNTVTVLLEHIDFSISVSVAILNKYLGGGTCPWISLKLEFFLLVLLHTCLHMWYFKSQTHN